MTQTKVKSAEVFSAVALDKLPRGEFPGVWGGYEAHAIINGAQYRFETLDGIRTPRADCIVRIRNGEVTVEAT